jgi:hypothetical protein
MRGQHNAVVVRPSLLAREAIHLTQAREHADRGSVAATGSSLVWPLGLLSMGIAAVVNVGLFETADAAGVSFRMKGQPDVYETSQQLTTGFREIVVTNVAINTVVPFLIGLALFRIALRRSVTAAVTVLVAAAAITIRVPQPAVIPPDLRPSPGIARSDAPRHRSAVRDRGPARPDHRARARN